MGWLKDEVREITQTVAGWPAWKRRESEGRMICFTESELQQHEERIINKALAEKDRAISAAVTSAYSQGYVDGKKEVQVELLAQIAEKDLAYQQLMAQAVRFAQYIMTIDDSTWASYKEAEAFLKEHHGTQA